MHEFWREMPSIYHTFASSLIPPNMGNLMIPAEILPPPNQQKGRKLGGWEIRLFQKNMRKFKLGLFNPKIP